MAGTMAPGWSAIPISTASAGTAGSGALPGRSARPDRQGEQFGGIGEDSAMPVVTLAHDRDFAGWRNAARALALNGVAAADVEWRIGLPATPAAPPGDAVFHVPRAFVDLARAVVEADDPDRFS